MKYYIIVFKNTLDAMNAEKKLKEKEISFKMMPTPTMITQSCGLCVRIDDVQYINQIIENEIVEFKNIYEKSNNEYNKIS